MSESIREKIIKTLVETYNIKKEDLNEAIRIQKKSGVGLEKVLVEQGIIKEKDLLMTLVRELNIPYINLGKYKIDPALQTIIPERIARQYKIVPISELPDTVTVAMSDPLNVFIIDDLKNITGKQIDIVMSTSTEIYKTIDSYYGVNKLASMAEASQDIAADEFQIVSGEEKTEEIEAAVDESDAAPVIRMVNLIIKEAIRQRASDIHMEPNPEGMRVRYRIDGVLRDILTVPKENQLAVTVRIKIMARIDITVSHIPQDGRFKLKVFGKEVDFRVSMLPATFGQKVVLRVLDKANLSVGLEGLGFSAKDLNTLKEASKKPFGMILVTGPTGSGKSTTLYTLVNQLNTIDKNVITIEDPVEYLVEGLTQIQTHAEIGLTFAEGLRAVLRQSPDVVMVGEIRDNETADIAIKASLTGQLVFATLHTNDAAGALTRLVDMKVEPFLVASSIILTSAQRLCRKICSKCKEPITISDAVLKQLNYKMPKDTVFYQGKGCEQCRNTGYKGRLGVTEMLELDDEIRNLLVRGNSSDDIKEYARKKKGMTTLFEDVMQKALSGITTIEEVLRITSNE